jgi:hypothetical protein
VKRIVLLMILTVIGATSSAYGAEQSLGNWDMSRVVWYRQHPDQTTAKLKWCVEESKGDAECGAAMQACNDLLKDNPKATCQSPMAR